MVRDATAGPASGGGVSSVEDREVRPEDDRDADHQAEREPAEPGRLRLREALASPHPVPGGRLVALVASVRVHRVWSSCDSGLPSFLPRPSEAEWSAFWDDPDNRIDREPNSRAERSGRR